MVDGPSLAHAQKLVAEGFRAKLVATPRLPDLARIAWAARQKSAIRKLVQVRLAVFDELGGVLCIAFEVVI